MTPELWQRVKATFDQALEVEETSREAWLRTACDGQPEVEGYVRRMLEEEVSQQEGPLDVPPVTVAELSRILDGLEGSFEPGEWVAAGRFRIVRFLGRGGMGEVWEAFDKNLGGPVALKTLRAGALLLDPRGEERLTREVKRALQVSHPNVCRVHDLCFHEDQPLLTMELLEGETLAERLARDEPLTGQERQCILEECAAGLSAIHQKGLIHRDFKTANVMLSGGRAVVMDFGLAQAGIDGESSLRGAGTALYMAPEQAAGADVTPAADVYSFAIVACEVWTGKRPAEGGMELLDARRRRLVTAALGPEPERRPALEQLIAPPRFSRRVIFGAAGATIAGAAAGGLAVSRYWTSQQSTVVAVLPFQSGAAAEERQFAESLAGDILRDISRSPRVLAVPLASVNRLAKGADPLTAGQALQARYVVSGSVSTVDGRRELRVDLVDLDRRAQIWGERIPFEATETLAVQRRVSRVLLAQMGQPPVGALDASGAGAGEAYETYLDGRHHLSLRTTPHLREARTCFEKAIAAEPQLTAAHAALAQVLIVMGERRALPPAEALPLADGAASRALALDPTLAEGHACKGLLEAVFFHRFAQAEKRFQQALDLQPNLVLAHQWLGYVLGMQRRFAEALRSARSAVELGRRSIPPLNSAAMLLLYAGDNAGFLNAARELLKLDPHHDFMYGAMAIAHARLGQKAESSRAAAQALAGGDPAAVRMAGEGYALIGQRDEAVAALARLINDRKSVGNVPASYIAFLLAGLGDIEESYHWLEIAWDEKDTFLCLLHGYPACASLRPDPRYAAFLQRLGLRSV